MMKRSYGGVMVVLSQSPKSGAMFRTDLDKTYEMLKDKCLNPLKAGR